MKLNPAHYIQLNDVAGNLTTQLTPSLGKFRVVAARCLVTPNNNPCQIALRFTVTGQTHFLEVYSPYIENGGACPLVGFLGCGHISVGATLAAGAGDLDRVLLDTGSNYSLPDLTWNNVLMFTIIPTNAQLSAGAIWVEYER